MNYYIKNRGLKKHHLEFSVIHTIRLEEMHRTLTIKPKHMAFPGLAPMINASLQRAIELCQQWKQVGSAGFPSPPAAFLGFYGSTGNGTQHCPHYSSFLLPSTLSPHFATCLLSARNRWSWDKAKVLFYFQGLEGILKINHENENPY